jgi:DNA-binding response OmpR family regulator
MSHKVLVADDSLTIQKVIRITLANQPFEVVDCGSEAELFDKLPQVKPKIVFLDFNLSEMYTGYELTSKIKSISPSTKVLLLLGTFDTVDEGMMEKCGASDKVVKPFDSNKFIAICHALSDDSDAEEIPYPESMTRNDFNHPAKEDDQWQVSHVVEPQAPVAPEAKSFDTPAHLSRLDEEVTSWGMSVPGVISDRDVTDRSVELPPVIESVTELPKIKPVLEAVKEKPKSDGPLYPESSDLDYPTIEELTGTPAPARPETTSKLIPIDSFTADNEFVVEHEINSMNESDVQSIEAQIRDEVEEDLWKVDEFEELKKEVSAKIEEVETSFQSDAKDFDDSLFTPLDVEDTINWNEENQKLSSTPSQPMANLQDLRAEMDSMVKKYVKEYMDEYFKKNVEKVSWEVIPDLAENLIRQELSKISNRIIDESK